MGAAVRLARCSGAGRAVPPGQRPRHVPRPVRVRRRRWYRPGRNGDPGLMHAPQRRRRWRRSISSQPPMSVAVAAAAAGLVAIGALPACHSGGSSRAKTKTTSGTVTTVTEVEPKNPRPASYRIVYHVEQPGAASNAERWEELTVRRPFEARSAVFSQRPGPGATPGSGTLATIDHLYQIRPDGLQEIAGRQPGPPTGDQALGPELLEASRR